MNNLEELMRELVKSSVLLKHKLYRRDEFASTTPEGTEAPTTQVHACLVCNRAAAGKEAHVRHKSDCPLAKLQRAQRALYGAWPELFGRKPNPEEQAMREGGRPMIPGNDLLQEIENGGGLFTKLGVFLRHYMVPQIQQRGRDGQVYATPIDKPGNSSLQPVSSLVAAVNPKSASYVGTDSSGKIVTAATPSSGITALTGDVNAGPGSGSQSSTVVSTHLAAPLPVAQGGSGTATPSLIAGSNVTITGSWPDQTIAASFSELTPVTLRVVSGTALTAGAQNAFAQVDFAGTIVGWSLTADQSGSVSIDVWKAASSPPPAAPAIPTSANKISATAGPSLSSAQSASQNAAGLTGWTTAVSAYDVFGFNIASASTVTAITLQIWIQRS